jgi:molecular chaperone DnaK
MVKQADQFAAQDQKRKEEAEVRNNADNLIYSAERLTKELAGKLSKEQTDQINKAITELREALGGKDVAAVKQKLEALQKVMQDVGTAAYQQVAQQRAGSNGQSASPPPPGQQGEKPVDVDYKVVDDKK